MTENLQTAAIHMKPLASTLRSDDEIFRAVQVLLTWSTGLPKGSIQVAVENGWVTLSGTANLAFARRDLAASIRYVMGVAGVSDQVTAQRKIDVSVAYRTDGGLHGR